MKPNKPTNQQENNMYPTVMRVTVYKFHTERIQMIGKTQTGIPKIGQKSNKVCVSSNNALTLKICLNPESSSNNFFVSHTSIDFLQQHKKVKLVTLVEGDPKVPFSIATTPKCSEKRFSISWIVPHYPWSIPYNTEC